MANMEDQDDDSDFILVERKNTMKRGKPQQQFYRPGSGPLKKSNTLEESESDTNISITSRNNQGKKDPLNNSRYKSEGNSPRERSSDAIDQVASHLEIMMNSEDAKRPKKPEKNIYVPRAVAQAREVGSTQDSKGDSFHNANGNQSTDKSNPNPANISDQHRNYSNRRNEMGIDDGRPEWRDQSLPRNRRKQGLEQRGINNGREPHWQRSRDTRSVEPGAATGSGRNYNEKIQAKPPSGRRHSTVGIEQEKRSVFKPGINIENLPPRLQKKYLAENNIQPVQQHEDDWDGSSVTFQSHPAPRNASFHPVTNNYAYQNQQYTNVGNMGYHTLPNKPRGRGRFNNEYESMPGHVYGYITPDAGPSPAASRPTSPPRRSDSRPQTPLHHQQTPLNQQPTPLHQPQTLVDRSQDTRGPKGYGGQQDSQSQTSLNTQQTLVDRTQDARGPRGYGGQQDDRSQTPLHQQHMPVDRPQDARGQKGYGQQDGRSQTFLNPQQTLVDRPQDTRGPRGYGKQADSRSQTVLQQQQTSVDRPQDVRGSRNDEMSYGVQADSRSRTPVNVNRECQGPVGKSGDDNTYYENTAKESGYRNQDRRGNSRRRGDQGNRRFNDYERDRASFNNRDSRRDNWETESHDSYNTRNRDRDIGNREWDSGNRGRDIGNRNRDIGNRDNDAKNRDRESGNRDRDLGNKDRDYGNRDRDYGNSDRGIGNWNKDAGNRTRETGNKDLDTGSRHSEIGNRDRATGNRGRETGHGDRDIGNWDRDGGNRRDQGGSGRRGRGSFRERRRDSRRERDKRSAGGNFVGPQENENWDEEVVVNQENNDLRPSAERQLSPVLSEEKFETSIQQINTQILDWSEEVELNDRLEAEYMSDAMTRSSSVISLQDISTKSLPSNVNNDSTSRKPKKRNRRRSRHRNDARENTRGQRSRQNSTASNESRDGFKVPYDNFHRRKSRDGRDNSYDRYHNSSRNISRDSSRDPPVGNWRDEMVKKVPEREAVAKNVEEMVKKGAERDTVTKSFEEIKNVDGATKMAGVLVLPQQKSGGAGGAAPKLNAEDHPRYPEQRKPPGPPKTLFDPNNPSKPILVKSSGSRAGVPGFSDRADAPPPPRIYTADQFGNLLPKWYDEGSAEFQCCHHRELIRDVKRADCDLQVIVKKGLLLVHWDMVDKLRQFLKDALQYLIRKAIKFCELENVEQHFWKILYHNIIEVTRKAFKDDPENKGKYKAFLLYLIDEGTQYFEGLLPVLEETYKFKLTNFLKENNMASHKQPEMDGLAGLALVSAQKICLFLGDLGRYREEVNETSNYGKCRQWYIKSQEINPKNGRPYNQLAILAVYARRKLDAVYYYMRSLMSTNPVPSARENLTSLFDENRKKYEQGEKKRREERLERQRSQMKRKESEEGLAGGGGRLPSSLRKETWVHPEGGRRCHRTTSAHTEHKDSDEEDLAGLTSVEVNKRFVISYLHVHGKLITNIGMESFQETAMQMLKEFRALLQHSPVPLPCNRFLQLLALNMFAIDSTQLKDPQLQSQPGYRSELQERALVVSLQMFNLILERCVAILQDHLDARDKMAAATTTPAAGGNLPSDAHVLLPAVKIWCDWMMCHTEVWNPPPSTQDFKIGCPGDAWSRLATLMNLLEKADQPATASFIENSEEGYEPVWLPEDTVLTGFTPLMKRKSAAPAYAPAHLDPDLAHSALRVSRLLFFGTMFLCGLEPPVLKLEIEDGRREYVSVVSQSTGGRGSPAVAALQSEQNNDVLLESFSEDEEDEQKEQITANASNEIRDLLTRKVELEKRQRSQDLHMQRVKKILSQSVVSVHMEIRPKYLVPDTNCFIDHLDGILTIAQSNCYTLMVPTVVLSELEGLSRGGRSPLPESRRHRPLDPQHVKRVAMCAKSALDLLRQRHSAVKCVTTKGAVLASTAFCTEEDDDGGAAEGDGGARCNDDKILSTCLVLCKGHKEQQVAVPEGEPRRLVREVVLLTDDRNLRVKAHAHDLPVRELPDFEAWAGLG